MSAFLDWAIRKETKTCEPVSSSESLSLTLQFFATGDLQSSITARGSMGCRRVVAAL